MSSENDYETDYYKSINNWLEVPFFNNLKRVIKERLDTVSDEEGALYLFTLIEGIKRKHPSLTDIEKVIVNDLDKETKERLYFAYLSSEEPSSESYSHTFLTFLDIIYALERTDCLRVSDNGDTLISLKGLEHINKVWENRNRDFQLLINDFKNK